MKRRTIMDQVFVEYVQENQYIKSIIDPIMATWTNPQSMIWLAQYLGYRCDCHENDFHFVKFAEIVDEDGAIDYEMTSHDFYF